MRLGEGKSRKQMLNLLCANRGTQRLSRVPLPFSLARVTVKIHRDYLFPVESTSLALPRSAVRTLTKKGDSGRDLRFRGNKECFSKTSFD